MAILNWFGKKQDRVRKEGAPARSIEPAAKPVTRAEDNAGDNSNKTSSRAPLHVAAYKVLRGAHITEKSTLGQQDGKYVFNVFPGAASPTVKQAVERMYKVHVQNVQIVKVHPQKRRRGRFVSLHKRPHKAIVTLRKGETIDVMA